MYFSSAYGIPIFHHASSMQCCITCAFFSFPNPGAWLMVSFCAYKAEHEAEKYGTRWQHVTPQAAARITHCSHTTSHRSLHPVGSRVLGFLLKLCHVLRKQDMFAPLSPGQAKQPYVNFHTFTLPVVAEVGAA